MTISKSFATTALSLESVAKTFIVLQCKTTFFTGMEDFYQFLLQLRALKIKIEDRGTRGFKHFAKVHFFLEMNGP